MGQRLVKPILCFDCQNSFHSTVIKNALDQRHVGTLVPHCPVCHSEQLHIIVPKKSLPFYLPLECSYNQPQKHISIDKYYNFKNLGPLHLLEDLRLVSCFHKQKYKRATAPYHSFVILTQETKAIQEEEQAFWRFQGIEKIHSVWREGYQIPLDFSAINLDNTLLIPYGIYFYIGHPESLYKTERLRTYVFLPLELVPLLREATKQVLQQFYTQSTFKTRKANYKEVFKEQQIYIQRFQSIFLRETQIQKLLAHFQTIAQKLSQLESNFPYQNYATDMHFYLVIATRLQNMLKYVESLSSSVQKDSRVYHLKEEMHTCLYQCQGKLASLPIKVEKETKKEVVEGKKLDYYINGSGCLDKLPPVIQSILLNKRWENSGSTTSLTKPESPIDITQSYLVTIRRDADGKYRYLRAVFNLEQEIWKEEVHTNGRSIVFYYSVRAFWY